MYGMEEVMFGRRFDVRHHRRRGRLPAISLFVVTTNSRHRDPREAKGRSSTTRY
jgi:hypothetical protein